MELLVGGVRGSTPVSGRAYSTVSGSTTSFLIRAGEGKYLIVDCGSGLQTISRYLSEGEGEVGIFLTHYHLDHLLGLPAFRPLYSPEAKVAIHGPVLGKWEVRTAVMRALSEPLWPVPESDFKGLARWCPLAEVCPAEGISYGEFQISYCRLQHPGGSVAYRIQERATGCSVVIATDCEWAASETTQRKELLSLIRQPKPPDLLIFDANYTPENYNEHRGWGHSTWEDAVAVAEAAGVGRLMLTHLQYDAPDGELAFIEGRAKRRFEGAFLGREDTELRFPAR